MRPIWLACMLPVGMASLVSAQTPLSFRDALTIAHQHNQQLHAADAQVERSRSDRAAERGLYFPTISAIGGYAHMNDRLFVDLNDLRPLLSALNPAVPIPPLTATVLENDPYRASITARWTVFAGGRILAANRAAQAAVTAAEQERRGAGNGITTELVDRYFKRRLAAEVLEVRRQALETFSKHLDDARRLKAAGQIARTDELRAEVARAEADREVKKAARDVNLASIALKSTLGGEVDAIPTTPLVLITGLEPRATFSAAADSGNPTISKLAALREQAHQGVSAAQGELFPSVSVFGTGELIQAGAQQHGRPQVGGRRRRAMGAVRRPGPAQPPPRRPSPGGGGRLRDRPCAGTRWPRWSSSATTNTSRRWSNTQSLETTVALAEESLRVGAEGL